MPVIILAHIISLYYLTESIIYFPIVGRDICVEYGSILGGFWGGIIVCTFYAYKIINASDDFVIILMISISFSASVFKYVVGKNIILLRRTIISE